MTKPMVANYANLFLDIFKATLLNDFRNIKNCKETLNTLSANPTKWSNTLKQFVSKVPRIV